MVIESGSQSGLERPALIKILDIKGEYGLWKWISKKKLPKTKTRRKVCDEFTSSFVLAEI